MIEVKVVRVVSVEDHPHPEAGHLTVNTLSNGARCISNRKEDDSARYQEGDLVVHVPERSIVPEWLLKRQDCWDDDKGKGTLGGSKGNRVKSRNVKGIVSEGMLVAGIQTTDDDVPAIVVQDNSGNSIGFHQGDDLKDFLGIHEWEG